MFKANLFKAVLLENNLMLKDVQNDLGLTRDALYRRMVGKTDWTNKELEYIHKNYIPDGNQFLSIFID